MLYYFPLEAYEERYTAQLSSEDGWLRRNWRAAGIPHQRILPIDDVKPVTNIKVGSVLDAVGRSKYAMGQVAAFLDILTSFGLAEDDVLFFDDFWHPGIEAIAYYCDQVGLKPAMYSTIYAQSVDEYDFTYPMRRWMRHFEKGIGELMSGVFVANTMLRNLVVEAGIVPFEKAHVTGLFFDSDEVKERMPVESLPRKRNVVFSSRFDWEKQPFFFLEVVAAVFELDPSITFTISTSAQKLRSNSQGALIALESSRAKYKTLSVCEGLTKAEYYRLLSTSKIQLNTALQDWVSFTLLEAATAGCYPLYPWFRSFPETLENDERFLYLPLVDACARKIVEVMNSTEDHWTSDAIEERSWIYRRFDLSWKRAAQVMGLLDNETYVPSLY